MLKKAYVAISLIFVVIVMSLIACSPSEKKDFLPYQDGLFESTATLLINSKKYTVDIIKNNENGYRISFSSPENMQGVCIDKDGDNYTYSVGSVHIPIKAGSNLASESFKLLQLSKESLVSSESALLNGVKVEIKRFKTEDQSVTLYLSEDTKLPLRIEADLGGNDVVLSFSKFEIK